MLYGNIKLLNDFAGIGNILVKTAMTRKDCLAKVGNEGKCFCKLSKKKNMVRQILQDILKLRCQILIEIL